MPSHSSDAVEILGEGQNLPTGQVHTGPSSTNISMFEKLKDDIKKAMLHPSLTSERFVPENVLKQLKDNDEVVRKVLEEPKCNSRLKRKKPISKLAGFVAKDAYRVFAILVWKGKPHL